LFGWYKVTGLSAGFSRLEIGSCIITHKKSNKKPREQNRSPQEQRKAAQGLFN
jgi:hypothetical protein